MDPRDPPERNPAEIEADRVLPATLDPDADEASRIEEDGEPAGANLA